MLINENTIEQSALATLQQLGWDYTDGRTITADGENPWRQRADEVIFTPILRTKLSELNPDLPENALDEVISLVARVAGVGLAEQNQQFYDYLCNGVRVTFQQESEQQVKVARLLDFQQPHRNLFQAVNQLSIQGNKGIRRPDVIAYINGLPLVVFELKNPLREQATLASAFQQLQTYQAEISDLFVFNQIQVISDGVACRIGSLTAGLNRFSPWRVVDEKNNSVRVPFSNELDALLNGLMPPDVLLNYLYSFVVFEQEQGKLVKKIAAYHQFYGVNEALDCTKLATGENGNGKIGVMWHTQGSGKSLSMLFYARKLLSEPSLRNPTLVIVTDRNDLDDQLFATFTASQKVLKTTPVQADSRDALRQALNAREMGGIIFTTIQKFALLDDELAHPMLNARSNIIVISDEAHRSQYGFTQSLKRSEQGSQYRFGYAKHLRDALPNAAFIGFTGTPISLEDRDTQAVFGKYVSIYDLQDAVEDGATVPLMYEPRQIPLTLDPTTQAKLNTAAKNAEEESERLRLQELLIGTDARLARLAADLVEHYEQRTAIQHGKAMIVCMSRQICVKLYQQLTALRPDWHSNNLLDGRLKIMMTGSAGDPAEMQAHIYSKDERKQIEKRFKDPDDPLDLVIVCDMWLTGFDVPCCNTLYLDKAMKGHNLAQAIARVNRVFRNKSRENGGLIVDYLGLSEELKKVMRDYSRANGKGEMVQDSHEIFSKMVEHLAVIRGQFATPVRGRLFDLDHALAETDEQALFKQLLYAAEHISGLDQQHKTPDAKNPTPRKNAFIQHARLAKKGYQLCGTLSEVKPYEKLLAFIDNVRAILAKNPENTTACNDDGKLLRLVSLLNRSVEAGDAVSLLDLLGRDQPNISLLSDEFLQLVQNSPTPNLWLTAAERYLRQEIKDNAATNLAMKKDFEQRLNEAMTKYHNQNISILEVLEELIKMGKDFSERLKRGDQLGLSPTEMAFYDALAQNESAVRELGDNVLRQLAQEITDKLRRSATLDWQYKHAVRAQMRILIKRALRHYKYPPDQEPAAIDKVIQQAEVIADELTRPA